ncbi:ZYBA0S03-11298g1_1 [Zygosaccharomyces bailii CLIB 213]|uniref:ZYBA0S03-11298g1_1 n=1 Tax=Zygosaccharomyces bailii (strain CLIB 213 / ATCC 58445 / CBS 680 / BCRC 21525 / NBRC 1098 / NCYC 1416 / NRRL Y-2227) TaxID=1333698 RepID=A0A8J2T550_ZYGB2|nr:ZYBA0S03-11298g1_1 [Zygosaccharomyces bailii CLIB 213]
MSYKNQDNNIYVPTTGGKNNPKHIHVAHRRSQSELTSLMIEQFTLQKQLEMVQQQQQQLLAQQHQLAQQTGQMLGQAGSNSSLLPPPPHYGSGGGVSGPNSSNGSGGYRSRSHSRNNSGYYDNTPGGGMSGNAHKKTGSQSSIYGHARRHSLGLNEAKKAAAEEQAKRNGETGSGVSVKVDDVSSSEASSNDGGEGGDAYGRPQSGFKFPSQSGHRRTNSNQAASFKFPAPPSNQKENDFDDFIPTASTHRRSRSKNNDYSAGINSNWRTQSQQPSPFHHRASNSRDFGNNNNSFGGLEPPPSFQAGHKHRSSNSSIHSFNSNNGNNPNARKSLFAPYLPQANIPELIQEGRLVAGILRVNKKNRSDAWVSTEGVLDADVYICGSKDRNRALEGDLVAVELLVVDDVWDSKKEKEEKKRRKDASIQHDIISLSSNDDYHNDASATASTTSNNITSNSASGSGNGGSVGDEASAKSGANATTDGEEQSPSKTGVKRRGSLKQRPTQKKNDDVEVEGQSLLLVEEEEINDDFKPLYAGHVIAVLDRIPGQLFSGTLGLLRPSQQAHNDNNNNNNNKQAQSPKIVWFKPTDKKVPLIAIPTELAPKDFVENADKYVDKLFVASIKRWPITSLHPFGVLVSELGEINDPNTEIDSILRDNNFLSNEYQDPKDPSTEKSISQALPVSEEDFAARRQFADEVVALEDRPHLSDFAIHIKRSAETIELGCHVVDVTAHIEEGSSLDRRARKRSTAVFMPQKVVDLLPQALNKSLALQEGKKSSAISVLYTLDAKTLKLKYTWVGESVIVPSAVISVEEVSKTLESGDPTGLVKLLEQLATAFYRERIKSPSAKLLPTLPLFKSLDDEKVNVDLNILNSSIGSVVLDEIRTKLDSTVAERIYTRLGGLAFLRRQVPPVHTKMASFKKKVQKLGYNLDIASPDALIQSILQIENDDVRSGVEILLFKTMSRARYFIAGKVDPDQYGHYALNLPLYTHFSAPLRRYADHVVHRQLKSVIKGVPYSEDSDSLKITSEYCNFKKDCAAQAQEQAVHLLLCKTINDMGNATGQLLTMATVLQVYESSFDVFIPEFGIEKRVHGDQLPLIKAEFDPVHRVLELHWQPGVDSAIFVPADEKNPKSYRTSIKNKFKSAAMEIATSEFEKADSGDSTVSEKLSEELSKLHIKVPQLRLPERSGKDAIESFIACTSTRRENDNYIQEIQELQQVPILLRAEVGMALPCLSVRALNPFVKKE